MKKIRLGVKKYAPRLLFLIKSIYLCSVERNTRCLKKKKISKILFGKYQRRTFEK